jgi:RNA polymerase sigma-70 factor (ECF subfamily)
MMFICCHPALPPESQITLTLKTLGGLSVAEIAKSLLMSQEAVQKRLYRAREKLRGSDFNFDISGDHELTERLDAVLSVIYLIFNEGYKSANARYVIRHELCLEAIRLALVLIEEPVFQKPACFALLALMHLQAARLPARIRNDGTICRIQDQDRTLWDQELIARGVRYLSKSAEGKTLTRYHLEAGIASCHSMVASFDVTDWKSILKYYDLLVRIYPSPVIKLNRAIALGYARGPKQAIRALEAIQEEGAMKEHYILFASLGEFHKQLGQNSEAKANYSRAVKLCHSDPERTLLNQSLEDCRVGYKERSKSD